MAKVTVAKTQKCWEKNIVFCQPFRIIYLFSIVAKRKDRVLVTFFCYFEVFYWIFLHIVKIKRLNQNINDKLCSFQIVYTGARALNRCSLKWWIQGNIKKPLKWCWFIQLFPTTDSCLSIRGMNKWFSAIFRNILVEFIH